MPYSGAPAQNPVPEQSQAAFVPSPMNQYQANPSAVQPADPNMGMNAVAKANIPENTQVRVLLRLSWIGHFRITFSLFLKASLGAHLFIWKWDFIHM